MERTDVWSLRLTVSAASPGFCPTHGLTNYLLLRTDKTGSDIWRLALEFWVWYAPKKNLGRVYFTAWDYGRGPDHFGLSPMTFKHLTYESFCFLLRREVYLWEPSKSIMSLPYHSGIKHLLPGNSISVHVWGRDTSSHIKLAHVTVLLCESRGRVLWYNSGTKCC